MTMPDALFGPDGTELPELPPDPAGRTGWGDTSGLPSLPLLAVPDARSLREAMDPAGPGTPAAQSPTPAAAPPASATTVAQPGEPAGTDATHPSPATAPVAGPAPPSAPGPSGAPAPSGAPSPPASPSRVAEVGSAERTIVLQPVPTQPPPRRGGGLRYRPPLAAASRTSVPPPDRRRWVTYRNTSTALRDRSNGGAGIAILVAAVVFGVLLYYIITGIADSLAQLLP